MMDNSSQFESEYDVAYRGLEITGLPIYQRYAEDITTARAQELMSEMNTDVPSGGKRMVYGSEEAQYLHFWPGQDGAPIVIYVHGGSWQIGTNLDSIGAAKVEYFTRKGYAFASINFTLVPKITVKEQVQQIAESIKFLVSKARDLRFDPASFVLMGHSSGAHVVTLLGTDASYLRKEGLGLDIVAAIIALDGANYDAPADIIDSPGSVASNMMGALGSDLTVLKDMSPAYHIAQPNAQAFLFLHVQRHGGIRQALALASLLSAVGTKTDVHIFEGLFFEGHVRLLLRLGQPDYPATATMDKWLDANIVWKK